MASSSRALPWRSPNKTWSCDSRHLSKLPKHDRTEDSTTRCRAHFSMHPELQRQYYFLVCPPMISKPGESGCQSFSGLQPDIQ
jgi:hypothetical protein